MMMVSSDKGNDSYYRPISSTATIWSSSTVEEQSKHDEALNDSGYHHNHQVSPTSSTTMDERLETEDPLNELKNHLIVVFVIVTLLMFCYLVMCVNSFLYEITCCPSKKSERLRRYYKGKLAYPLPWDVALDQPNKEYSCSDLKVAASADQEHGNSIEDATDTCNCQPSFYYYDEVDDEVMNISVSSTNLHRYAEERLNSQRTSLERVHLDHNDDNVVGSDGINSSVNEQSIETTPCIN